MVRTLAAIALLALAACDGNPLDSGGIGGGGTGTGACNTTDNICAGEINRISYDPATDKLRINNLPFDLSGTYSRVSALDRNGFSAYVNDSGSRTYVALYRRSASGAVRAGVVGTGDYLSYGYGGTNFGNSGNVNFPNGGEATYVGNYAGIRVYEGGGIGFSDGTARLDVDFDDFDTVGAIDTIVTNRRAYNSSGASIGTLPNLSGKTTGFTGNIITSTQVVEVFPGGATGATGTLTGIFGGSNATEVAGVIVITGADPLSSGQNVKESGAFILLRTSYTP